jgi:phosphate ABC transporter permease subunit PstA
LSYGVGSPEAVSAKSEADKETQALQARYQTLSARVAALRQTDDAVTVTLEAVDAQTKTLPQSRLVRFYPANALSTDQKWSVYGSRWVEFITVPSIVYGVFGLGFFCYIVGGSIDQVFFAEKLPNPTFGTGGMLWASLTLALLTVPVVIVATEEALAAVPRSMREGSLACGASKWQTIWRIVLPRAAPGVMTGLILAMARGAGEVAPLMIVGVVKLAPELPVDLTFPYAHLERSFMHLGFHIYDVGFQSRNSEAGRPMVFVTTLLLITLVLILNAFAIYVRTRLKRAYQVGQF